ncbi:MAG TPA: response regulator [Sandaracinaceae bacterium LLY-WYZ-13_1]|nr:response regulator [Sandaracinaceae bacterium LLY-WYZ-13_1]
MTMEAIGMEPPSPARVVVVDDDASVTYSVGRLLARAGWDVQTSNRSFGVLNLVAEHRPDVLVVDMRMPGLDGAQLTELVRGDPELAGVRVVLHSGVEEEELARRAQEVRADAWVSKYEGPHRLLEIVQGLRRGPLRVPTV